MSNIDFTVIITGGGAGIGVFIKVDNQVLHFDTSDTQTLQLDPNSYTAVISGAEPSDDSVNVKIVQNGNILRSCDYSDSFWGLMAFTAS